MALSRRLFSSLGLSAPFLSLTGQSRAQSASPQAHIKLDTDRVIGEVHPHVFGNFAEHLGRCIYGGLYEEGSPLADADGFRKDVMEAIKGMGVTLLRWPGGNFVSGYNWKDGIGPKDQRPTRPDQAWGDLESNRFGTDEFLRYCQKLQVDPYICINAGLGSIDEAREWVEYCNEPRRTSWAEARRRNGRETPWGVKVWGLGNEIDGPWQLGAKNVEDYVKFAREAGKAMRRADGSISLIASGSSNFGGNADWVGWNREVLEGLKGEIDYISLHTYIGNRQSNFERFLAVSRDIDYRIQVVEGMIHAAKTGRRGQRPIYIAFDEWNVWYRARSGNSEFDTGRTRLEERYNFEDALAMGMFLNSFLRHAHIVKMANLAQIVNVIAPIFTNPQGLYLQTIYFPLAEYAKQKNNISLNALVQSPTYSIDNREPIPYLDVSATHNKTQNAIYLNVLNKSESKDIATRIDEVDGKLSGDAELWFLNHDDFKTEHTFGDDKKVRPTVTPVNLRLDGRGFQHTFPAHSLSIVKLPLKA
ncbi:MAG: alpha-N-arabinofuranosidase [Bryobacterales bacterium]|nr:alpha-N-arabinofuranosidase [Bryobacterales bacterium]